MVCLNWLVWIFLIKVEWPGKENVANPPKGYVYIIFDNEKHVKSLLQACTHDFSNGGSWYYKISSRRMRSKEVQVIPWMLNDSNYVRTPAQRLDPQKTVFVGALHGMLNAEGLGHIMNDLFGGVLYAGIDTDKFKYPIGSGRVTFNNDRSYTKAVAAAFIEIKTPKFTKKVQVDPYLEDSLCANCGVQQVKWIVLKCKRIAPHSMVDLRIGPILLPWHVMFQIFLPLLLAMAAQFRNGEAPSASDAPLQRRWRSDDQRRRRRRRNADELFLTGGSTATTADMRIASTRHGWQHLTHRTNSQRLTLNDLLNLPLLSLSFFFHFPFSFFLFSIPFYFF